MLKKNLSIEEAIMHLSVMYRDPDAKPVKLDSSDYALVNSLAKQVYKKLGFTDRQYELARLKIREYADQFDDDFDVETVCSTLKYPLREIDRSRWIRLVEIDGVASIAVRFVFQKKLISKIEMVKQRVKENSYDAQNKIHNFAFSEYTVHAIITAFKDAGFDIQQELIEYYDKLEHMINNKKDHLPGVYGYDLKNLHEKSFNYAVSSVGTPDKNTLHKFYDRKEQLGLYHFEQDILEQSLRLLTPLTRKIVERKLMQVQVDPKKYTVDNVAETILELDRFPLLVVISERNCYDELSKFHKAFNGVVSNTQCAVLFRMDNTTETAHFNDYIKDNNLNNLVDNDTKIVYISSSKFPKPLLKNNWYPQTAITTYSGYSGSNNKVDGFLDTLDLVIHYDTESSSWKRNRIEKI
jgi:hypothetical protein